jgi:hypothetical protein
MKHIYLSLLVVTSLLYPVSHCTAQQVPVSTTISLDPTMAVPQFTPTGTVMTAIVKSAKLSGVRFREGMTGATYLYMPVNLPDKSTLNYLQIEADGSDKAFVLAEFLRISNAGDVESLGSVATVSVGPSGFGAQIQSSKLRAPVQIDKSKYLYLTRVQLKRPDGTQNPMAYKVLSSDRCMPSPGNTSCVSCPPGPPAPSLK